MLTVESMINHELKEQKIKSQPGIHLRTHQLLSDGDLAFGAAAVVSGLLV